MAKMTRTRIQTPDGEIVMVHPNDSNPTTKLEFVSQMHKKNFLVWKDPQGNWLMAEENIAALKACLKATGTTGFWKLITGGISLFGYWQLGVARYRDLKTPLR